MKLPIQYILLDHNGQLIKSCNSLFDTKALAYCDILHHFPIVDNLFSYLITLPINN